MVSGYDSRPGAHQARRSWMRQLILTSFNKCRLGVHVLRHVWKPGLRANKLRRFDADRCFFVHDYYAGHEVFALWFHDPVLYATGQNN